MYLGQGDGEELGSPALGVVAQSWHHPNIPDPPLIPSAGLSDALCRIQPSRDSQGAGTGLWLAGRRPQSSPSWSLPAQSGLVLQEPFPPIFLISWCLQRWGKHPGSACGSEELRYLGASGLGKIPWSLSENLAQDLATVVAPRFPLPVGEVSWFVLFLLSLALSLSLLLLSLFLSLLHFCESNDALILPRFSLLFIPYLLKEEMPLFW